MTNKKSSVGDYRGISINGQNGGTLNHIYIRNCFVHDVTGEVIWIGGDTADNAPGITFQAGWDASKRTGGIVFDVQAGTGTAVKTKFNDVLVEDNVVQDCSFGGIIFKQLDGTRPLGDPQLGDQHDLDARTPTSSCAGTTSPSSTPATAATRST